MSYTIYHYNPNLPAITTVADGTVDTTTDLKLIGKSYAGYGLAQNENFVYLLENFANSVAPVNPLTGQIWYDSSTAKIKFYDGTQFRVVGGADVSATTPSGLSLGDFWFDTLSNQLFAYNGSSFTLIGPQAVNGSANTQMQSISLKDKNGGSHAVIAAYDNGNVIFTISSDSAFEQDSTANATLGFSTGYDWIYKGVTLVNTNNPSQIGVTNGTLDTSSNSNDTNLFRFWGTATNADQLGGVGASGYVLSSNAVFGSQVNFSDQGYTVGASVKLQVFNDGNTTPTFRSTVNSTPIVFQTTNSSSQTVVPLKLYNTQVLPGDDLTCDLGANTGGGVSGTGQQRWRNIYANYVYATAQQADALTIQPSLSGPNQATIANATGQPSIVARDNGGNINVTQMNGIATRANQVLFNTNYVSAASSATASTIMARDASGNTAVNLLTGTATQANTLSFNGNYVNATNAATVSTVVARDSSGNFSANTITANLTGNVNGFLTGSVKASDNSTLIDYSAKTFTGAVVGNVTGTATQANALQVNGSTYEVGSTVSTANTIVARDSSRNVYANIFYGTASSANYADLAEKYLADSDYTAGTVVSVGGDAEVTACKEGDRPIGVVSISPAYMMNSELEGGIYIALKGRVPTLVQGAVRKGDKLIAGQNGFGVVNDPLFGSNGDVFAIALEDNTDGGVKLVECVIL
jgi:hypothetical protein